MANTPEMVKIGDLCKIKHGWAFKGENFTSEGKYILLTPGNFQNEGGLKLKGGKEKYYSAEFPKDYLLNKGDLIVAMTDLVQSAPLLGGSALVPEDNIFLHNQRLGKVINLNKEKVIKEYLYWVLNSREYRAQVRGSATGATVRHTAPERIYSCNIPLPNITTQRKIACILSAYDDLIENNNKRIKILEEMAQKLYKEWFVDFKFPNHENTKFVESELGKIPKGWEVVNLFNFANVDYGYNFKSKLFTNETTEVPVVRIRDIKPNKTSTYSTENVDKKYSIEDKDILIGMDGNFYMENWSGGKAYLNQRVCRIRPKNKEAFQFLILSLAKAIHFFNSTITGTTVAHLADRDLKTINFVTPSKIFSEKLYADLEVILEEKICLNKQIHNLRKTRDLLLPRLISGELSVENLDNLEAAA